jgi:hypothetical protein
MKYEFPIKPSRRYICPPNATPAWRDAYEAGIDMAAIEDNLMISPEAHLERHAQRMSDHFKREEFLQSFRRGSNLINSQHVHPRHP